MVARVHRSGTSFSQLHGAARSKGVTRCKGMFVVRRRWSIDCTAFANRTRPGGIASPSAFGAKRARRSPGHFLHYRNDKVVPVFFVCVSRLCRCAFETSCNKGGPCGVVAPVQAHLLARILTVTSSATGGAQATPSSSRTQQSLQAETESASSLDAFTVVQPHWHALLQESLAGTRVCFGA